MIQRRSLLSFVTVLTVAGGTLSAAPRHTDEYGNTTPAWAPAWCGTYRGATGTGYQSVDDDLAKEGYFAERPMRALAQAQCEFRKGDADTAKIRAVAAKYRAEFGAALGLAPAELDALLALHINQQQTNKITAAACEPFRKIDTDLEAKEYGAARALARVACGASGAGDYDWFDTSAVGNVAFAVECAESLASSLGSKQEARRPWNLAAYARCEAVGARLDKRAYLAEIEAARLQPFARLWAKAQFQRAQAARAKVRAYYGALAAQDPAIAKVIVEAPKAALAAFTAMRQEERKLVDQTAQVLANLDKKRVVARHKDCSAPYLSALTVRITQAAPTTLDAARALFDAPLLGYLTAGFAVCEGTAQRDAVAATFAEQVGALPTGPRDAALWGALQAIAAHRDELEGADDFRGMAFSTRPRLAYGAGFGGADGGVIAAVSAPADGVVKVKFKKESWMEPVWKCRDTNRIDRVEFDGNKAKFIYRQNCVPAGQRKVEKQLRPTEVDARFAAGLKPGRFAVMRLSARTPAGFPQELWADKSRKALVGYFGFSWK